MNGTPVSDHPLTLPPGLPVPQDDGACDHLGRPPFHAFPCGLKLPCTNGGEVDLFRESSLPLVLFLYPRTGVPGQPPSRGFDGEEWDEIPGARGCTPQGCSFRDLHDEFRSREVAVYGLSTNTTEHQLEFKRRNHIPFDFLSDADLRLARSMALPTFEFPVESGGPTTLLRRAAIYCESGAIRKVWYPVFPPDRNARTVLDWIAGRPAREARIQAAASRTETVK